MSVEIKYRLNDVDISSVDFSDDSYSSSDEEHLHWKSSTKFIEDLPWFHGDMTRNTVEALLLSNGVEGSYLVRNSKTNPGNYTVSVRCRDSIKHYTLLRNTHNNSYTFGVASFSSYQELIDHFECKPVLSGETGPAVVLRFPYIKDVPEPGSYEKVLRHCEDGKEDFVNEDLEKITDLHIASKEGFLIKRGAIHKNWKKRWFVLRKNMIQYYARKEDFAPIRMIDLRHAVIAAESICDNRSCISLVLPTRTFYLVTNNMHEFKGWLELLQWKIEYYKVRRVSEVDTLNRRGSPPEAKLKRGKSLTKL